MIFYDDVIVALSCKIERLTAFDISTLFYSE